MSDINDLISKLDDPDPQIRLEAAKELADLAENGSDKAAEILYERIKKETDQEILIAILTVILENPCKNEDEQRIRFVRLEQFAYQPRILPILPVLRKLKKVPEKLKNSIVRFAKSVVEIHGASGCDTHFAMEFLAFLMDEHDLFAFVDFWLKKVRRTYMICRHLLNGPRHYKTSSQQLRKIQMFIQTLWKSLIGLSNILIQTLQ